MARSAENKIPTSTAYVCAYVVFKAVDGYKFLLLKRKTPYMRGLWGQVAGKIEDGETAAQAVYREIKEETGQTPSALYSADIIESFYELGYNAIQLIPAFVAFVENPDIVISYEHSEFRWVTPDEAKALFPFHQQKSSVEIINREFLEKEPLPQLRIDVS